MTNDQTIDHEPPYRAPADLGERVANLERDLANARDEWERSRQNAKDAGGLLGALASLEAETKRLQVSQIEYQLLAARNGFPPYLAVPSEAKGTLAPQPTTGRPAYVAPQAISLPATPTREEQEASVLTSALVVTLLDKKLHPRNLEARVYSDYLTFEFQYENKTDKEIRAFTGTTIFMDIFDRPFYRVRLTVDDRIPPNSKVVDRDRSIEINQFSDEQRKLTVTRMENLHVRFEPSSILFADGTRIGNASE